MSSPLTSNCHCHPGKAEGTRIELNAQVAASQVRIESLHNCPQTHGESLNDRGFAGAKPNVKFVTRATR